MKVLMIGNGFDLAHGLPTRYKDFVDFCKKIKDSLSVPDDLFSSDLQMCINDNLWIGFFIQKISDNKENWIDFESEISRVIQILSGILDKSNEDSPKFALSEKDKSYYEKMQTFFKENNFSMPTVGQSLTWKNQYGTGSAFFDVVQKLSHKLELDLADLTRALEIYLAKRVNEQKCDIFLNDISKFGADHVLSFNYTTTYHRIYRSSPEPDTTSYIHGKADYNHPIEKNNMVLGIDEYLPDERKNSDVKFIEFKKYYQRIIKKTSSEYLDWLEEMEFQYKSHNQRHQLVIFGHSLDVTDKDVHQFTRFKRNRSCQSLGI